MVSWGETTGPQPALSSFPRRTVSQCRGHFVVKHMTGDGVWAIYFNTDLVVTLDERDLRIRG